MTQSTSPTAEAILSKALIWGSLLAAGIGIVISLIGFAVDGSRGLVSGLLGTAIAIVFLGITAASMLIARNFSFGAFFGTVMGAWLLKFVVFFIVVLLLRGAPWLNNVVFALALIAGVIVTLVVDVVVVSRSRLPAIDVTLPGE